MKDLRIWRRAVMAVAFTTRLCVPWHSNLPGPRRHICSHHGSSTSVTAAGQRRELVVA